MSDHHVVQDDGSETLHHEVKVGGFEIVGRSLDGEPTVTVTHHAMQRAWDITPDQFAELCEAVEQFKEEWTQ